MVDGWQDEILMAIPSLNGGKLLSRMLPTLRFDPSNTLVLDQGGTDATETICSKAGVEVVQLGTPHSYTRSCNIGIDIARQRNKKYICIANNDIVFRSDVMAELYDEMQRDDRLGIVAPSQIIFESGVNDSFHSHRVRWDLSSVSFLHDFSELDGAVERLESDFCELTCALVRMSAIEQVGALDDEYGFYHEDADFGFRLRRAGFNCAYLPRSQIEHFTGSTIRSENRIDKSQYIRKNKIYFARKNLGYGVQHPRTDMGSLFGDDSFGLGVHKTLVEYGLCDSSRQRFRLSEENSNIVGRLFAQKGKSGEVDERHHIDIDVSFREAARNNSDGISDRYHIPVGVDVEIFHPWEASHRTERGLTYLAVIDGQHMVALQSILKAWHQFAASRRDIRLILLGRGLSDCMGRAPCSVRRAGAVEISLFPEECVEIYETSSPMRPRDLAALYCAVDYTIFCPTGERNLLPVLESLACGVPCITGDYGLTADLALERALAFPAVAGEGSSSPNGSVPAHLIPDIGAMAACLEESAALGRAARHALGRQGLYRVRGRATLRHTAMGLYDVLSQVQPRDPARFLERLAASASAAGPAGGGGAAPARRRLSQLMARQVSKAGALTSQFGLLWQEKGFAAAARTGAGKLRGAARHRALQASRLSMRFGGRLRFNAENAIQDLLPRAEPIADSVLLIGYVDAQLGLGQSSRGLALAMAEAGIRFGIYPFGVGVEGRRSGSFMPERYDRSSAHAVNIIEVMTDELPTVFRYVSRKHFDRSYNVLRTYWELSQAPQHWAQVLREVDEIWAPNQFVADSMRTVFDRTITIVPPCVDIALENQAIPEYGASLPGAFRFFFSFDYHSFPSRKNPLAVVRAFRRAFPDTAAPVALVIKSSGGHQHSSLKDELLDAVEHDARIRIIDGALGRQEMLALIGAMDCYVSLHRAEGFGMGMAEAMALGKPVIATHYSGNTDFLSEDTGYPVGFRLRKVGPREYVHTLGQVWAEPSESDCAASMLQVFVNRQEAMARARRAQLFVRDRYGPANVGRIARERLAEIFLALQNGQGAGRA